MANINSSKITDLTLNYWEDLKTKDEQRSAFRKKFSWVVSTSGSKALWYMIIISNLYGKYLIPDVARIDVVTSLLSEGLNRTVFDRLKSVASISGEEFSRAVRIPPRTLARREIFKPDESERILRVAAAFQRTIEVLGDVKKARRWFSTSKQVLGGRTPLQFCDTGPGSEEVISLLGRMEHGVFS